MVRHKKVQCAGVNDDGSDCQRDLLKRTSGGRQFCFDHLWQKHGSRKKRPTAVVNVLEDQEFLSLEHMGWDDRAAEAADRLDIAFERGGSEAVERLLEPLSLAQRMHALEWGFDLKDSDDSGHYHWEDTYRENALDLHCQGLSCRIALNYHDWVLGDRVNRSERSWFIAELLRPMYSEVDREHWSDWELVVLDKEVSAGGGNLMDLLDTSDRNRVWASSEEHALCLLVGCLPEDLERSLTGEKAGPVHCPTWVQPETEMFRRQFCAVRGDETHAGSTIEIEERESVDLGGRRSGFATTRYRVRRC